MNKVVVNGGDRAVRTR
jgi:hypothetical protein